MAINKNIIPEAPKTRCSIDVAISSAHGDGVLWPRRPRVEAVDTWYIWILLPSGYVKIAIENHHF